MKWEVYSPSETLNTVQSRLLAFLGYSNSLWHRRSNASSLARSAAEVKPDHAGAQYISLAITVELKTSAIDSAVIYTVITPHISVDYAVLLARTAAASRTSINDWRGRRLSVARWERRRALWVLKRARYCHRAPAGICAVLPRFPFGWKTISCVLAQSTMLSNSAVL